MAAHHFTEVIAATHNVDGILAEELAAALLDAGYRVDRVVIRDAHNVRTDDVWEA